MLSALLLSLSHSFFFTLVPLSSFLSLPPSRALSRISRQGKSSIMVATWAGDAVAPFFGFIGAAAALVFSCACCFLSSLSAFIVDATR